MEARALTLLVETVLERSWSRAGVHHGEDHWRCVTASGLTLAVREPGADAVLAFCFGLVHDTRRQNEHYDPGHGPRAAELVRALAGDGLLPLSSDRVERLADAVERHADGLTSADPTTGACWDADRVHLPRVGIVPDPRLLSTSSALDRAVLDEAAALRAAPPAWSDLVARVAEAQSGA